MEGKKEEEELIFLSSYFPPKIHEKISQCCKQIDTLRLNLLQGERTISLLPLLNSPSNSHSVIPKKADIINNITNPIVLRKKDVTPSIIQHAAIFTGFIYTRPDLFAKVVCKHYGQQDFQFLVFSVVPSFFGFFSSYEHVAAATCFYQNVIMISQPNVAAVVLHPFFCSLGTSRFIECVMGPFCQRFGVEIKFDDAKKNKSKLYKEFSEDLIKNIRKNLKMLPPVFITMFITMIHKNWSLKSLEDMFFNHFFTPQALSWIAASPFSHRISVFQKILCSVLKDDSLIKNMFAGFISTKPLFELASLYRAFDQDYIQILISVSDLMCASLCYKSEKEFPYSLRDFNYEAFPAEKRFSPFFIKVFIKQNVQVDSFNEYLIFKPEISIPIEDNIVFERIYRKIQAKRNCINVYEELMNDFKSPCPIFSSEQTRSKKFIDYCRKRSLNVIRDHCNSFESYLGYKVFHEIAIDWNNFAEKRQDILLTPIALNAAKAANNFYKKKNVGKAFAKASQLFKSNELKKLQFYKIVMPAINNEIEKKSSLFDKLEKAWHSLLKRKKATMDPELVNSLTEHSKYLFWECVEEFRSLCVVSHSRQFDLLMSVVRKMYSIGNFSDSAINLIITFSEITKLPQIVILSNSYIIGCSTFASIFDNESKILWRRFFSLIMEIIYSDEETEKILNKILCELEDASFMDYEDSDSSSSSFSITRINDLNKLPNYE